jgi:hypothetical protein
MLYGEIVAVYCNIRKPVVRCFDKMLSFSSCTIWRESGHKGVRYEASALERTQLGGAGDIHKMHTYPKHYPCPK